MKNQSDQTPPTPLPRGMSTPHPPTEGNEHPKGFILFGSEHPPPMRYCDTLPEAITEAVQICINEPEQEVEVFKRLLVLRGTATPPPTEGNEHALLKRAEAAEARVAELEAALATPAEGNEQPPARPCDVWLKRLPRWIQERAERAMARPDGVCSNALSGAFTWSSTPEGAPFWDCVDNHLSLGTPLPVAPPDDPEHNPDNLTPEQVGVAGGWRLLRRSEVLPSRSDSVAVEGWWSYIGWRGGNWMACDEETTYRTRLPYGELDKAPTQ